MHSRTFHSTCKRAACLGAVLALLAWSPVRGLADALPLFGTGQGLSNGSADTHWPWAQPTGGAGGTPTSGPGAFVLTALAPGNLGAGFNPWLPNGSGGTNAKWVGGFGDAQADSPNGSNTILTESFNLTGYSLPTVQISGRWAVDDNGVLDINGNTLSTLNTVNSNWDTLHTFTVPTNFLLPGVNAFHITILSADNNYDGAYLAFDSATASVPEPATLYLSLIAISLLATRRRSSVHP